MPKTNDIYCEAKKALNASAPDRVVARFKENEQLEEYFLTCVEQNKTMSLYINGQPGTGKTLTINYLIDNLKTKKKFKKIYVNCMLLKNVQGLYKIIAQELALTSIDQSMTLTPSKRSTKDGLARSAEQVIVSHKTPIMLILDEIDQIEKSIKSPADLYKIFEWPFLSSSKLILIGIANSLDFTERLLPRLELKPECKPKILNFTPYSKEDIIMIVKDRLKDIQEAHDNCVIIEDKALGLCATKIASANGDIRKVLDICRRAIELVENEVKFNNKDQKEVAFKPVGIATMMKVFNEVNPMTTAKFERSSMPLTQKVLLCTILLFTKESKVKDVVLSKLFDRFNKICDTKIESESEFINLCNLVQDNGLIDVKKAKEIRNYKISLRIDEQELRDRLEDEVFIGNILASK